MCNEVVIDRCMINVVCQLKNNSFSEAHYTSPECNSSIHTCQTKPSNLTFNLFKSLEYFMTHGYTAIQKKNSESNMTILSLPLSTSFTNIKLDKNLTNIKLNCAFFIKNIKITGQRAVTVHVP